MYSDVSKGAAGAMTFLFMSPHAAKVDPIEFTIDLITSFKLSFLIPCIWKACLVVTLSVPFPSLSDNSSKDKNNLPGISPPGLLNLSIICQSLLFPGFLFSLLSC